MQTKVRRHSLNHHLVSIVSNGVGGERKSNDQRAYKIKKDTGDAVSGQDELQREAGAISTACFHLEGELENSDAGEMMPLLSHPR
jgi:hypothetical protein